MKRDNIKHMFITRVEGDSPYWSVRFRLNGKVVRVCTFRDSTNGGNAKALKAAIARRDELAKKAGITLDEDYWRKTKEKPYRYVKKRHQNRNNENSTGIVGVCYYANGTNRYYRASICLEKYKEKVHSFNCDKLGDEEALRLAIEQRKAWELQVLEGRTK